MKSDTAKYSISRICWQIQSLSVSGLKKLKKKVVIKSDTGSPTKSAVRQETPENQQLREFQTIDTVAQRCQDSLHILRHAGSAG